jgi:hypothetical protein
MSTAPRPADGLARSHPVLGRVLRLARVRASRTVLVCVCDPGKPERFAPPRLAPLARLPLSPHRDPIAPGGAMPLPRKAPSRRLSVHTHVRERSTRSLVARLGRGLPTFPVGVLEGSGRRSPRRHGGYGQGESGAERAERVEAERSAQVYPGNKHKPISCVTLGRVPRGTDAQVHTSRSDACLAGRASISHVPLGRVPRQDARPVHTSRSDACPRGDARLVHAEPQSATSRSVIFCGSATPTPRSPAARM